jgi:ArsR family transcriptional regulator
MRGYAGTERYQAGRRRPQWAGRQQVGPALEQLVSISRALGHPIRARLVAFLGSRGGAYVSELVPYLQRAQPTVSHHLKVLARAGVVRCEQRGTRAWYQVVPETLARLSQQLSALVTAPVAPVGATCAMTLVT